MNKLQDAELDKLLDGYQHRDERRQQEIDDRHSAERDFYAGFQTLVTDVIRPELTRLAEKLIARGHRCHIDEEPASATNEGYDRPGAIRFVFVPDHRHSQGHDDDPAAVFAANTDRTVHLGYSEAVPVIVDPATVSRNVELREVTCDVISGQIVALVKALL